MKSLIKVLLLTTAVIFFTACDDEPENTSTHLLLYNLPAAITEESWLVISDDNGLVLGYEKLDRAGEFKLLPSSEFSQKELTVTFITREFSGFIKLNTIVGVKPGSYAGPAPVTSEHKGTHIILAPMRDGCLEFNIVGTKNFYSLNTEPDSEYQLQLSEPTGDFYVAIRQSFTNRRLYSYHPSVSVGDTTLLDESHVGDMTEMIKHPVDFPPKNASTYVRGVKDGRSYYCSSDYGDVGTPVAHYPAELLGTVFDSFKTECGYSEIVGEFNVSYSYAETSKEFFSKLQEMDLTLTSLTKRTYPEIELSVTGTADCMNFTLVQLKASWEIYAPVTSALNLKLPQFTQALVNELEFEPSSDFRFYSLEFFDSNTIESYDQVITTELKADVSTNSTGLKRKRYMPL